MSQSRHGEGPLDARNARTDSPRCAQRFTLDGSPELEQRLEDLCRQIGTEVWQLVPKSKLEALVLGGGYGRGQGGVLKTAAGDEPYNDMEFYVFLRGNSLWNDARYRKGFQRLGESLCPRAGLHVEFKIDSLDKLRRAPVSIFSYDLVCGHRVIYGTEASFHGCQNHADARRIVPTEASRLLLNRCSGLLLVKELLLKPSLTAEECDFIGRNLAKAKLALGDALLAAAGQYHWDCLERERRLREFSCHATMPLMPTVLALHADGVRFKLHPVRILQSLDQFKAEHRELTELALGVWLWIENQRLRSNFSTLQEYSFSSVEKCSHGGAWRNWLLNVRTFGAGASLDKNAPRYPRERLFNALPLLLETNAQAGEANTTRHLQRQLRTNAQDWRGLVAAYKHVWSCYG